MKKQMLLWPKLYLPLDCFQRVAGLTLTPRSNLEAVVRVMEAPLLAWSCNSLAHTRTKLF